MPDNIARKTKTEILDEYKKLRQELEAAQRTATQVAEPRSQELLKKTERQTENDVLGTVQTAKTTINSGLNQLAEAMSGQVAHLQELREAVALWQKNLENYRNVTVAAGALEALIGEYDLKKRQFEAEAAERRFTLDKELENKKRVWEEAQDDREYETKRKHKQLQEEFDDKNRKREKEIAERAEQIAQRERELSSWQQQVKDFSQKLEDELKKKELEVTNRLEADHEMKMRQLTQERQAEKSMLGLQVDNLRERSNQQQSEINSLQKALDEANARSQDLAAKVIEGNRPVQIIAKKEQDQQ